jgi:hypothetical protein
VLIFSRLLITGLLTAGAFALPGAADADCCTGPPVMVSLPHWTPLTATLHPTVATDDPEHTYRATLRPYLKVGRHRIARLDEITIDRVTLTPARIKVTVPSSVRARAARYGARTHHRHATITFVVAATDRATGQDAWAKPWGEDVFVTLPRTSR